MFVQAMFVQADRCQHLKSMRTASWTQLDTMENSAEQEGSSIKQLPSLPGGGDGSPSSCRISPLACPRGVFKHHEAHVMMSTMDRKKTRHYPLKR